MKKIEMTKKATLDQGYDEFIFNCKARNLREYTVKFYDNTIRTIYKFIEPKTYIDSITSDTVDNFILSCKKELDIKDTTINTYLRALKTILYFFMEKGYMKEFKISLVKMDKEIIETYSKEELDSLLKKPNIKKCDFIEYRNWVICNFLLAVGCRLNSLINLKVEDIDFNNNLVYLKTTKNRRPLIIPLSETIILILKEYIDVRKGESDDYLFCTAFGTQVNRNTISGNLRIYNRRRGVTTTGIHRFRHTFAKNWILNGGDIFRLQKILGHSDMEVVRNYVNMFTNDLQKDFNEFNPLENILKKEDNKKSIKMR